MLRSAEIWLPGYLAGRLKKRRFRAGDTLCLAVADHFEPYWGKAGKDRAGERMAAWETGLPRLAASFADSRGRGPVHDFFYPLDEYDPHILDRLARLRQDGLGEVEVHLHHHGETPDELAEILLRGAGNYHRRHGLLRQQDGQLRYGFIHGNWALDNSLPDGTWCGVNNELDILRRTGCFADFTLPAAPSPAQTSTVNAIYYAADDPGRPKSHDRGTAAQVGRPGPPDSLLMVQGVLALNWRSRKWGLLPRLENSDLCASNPPAPGRIGMWLDNAPWVEGAEEVRFLKLHCHGGPEANHQALLGEPMRNMLNALCRRIETLPGSKIYFMTCWEMVQAIHRLERGETLL